jgi:tetratricopeptide (TPR) repeat protein
VGKFSNSLFARPAIVAAVLVAAAIALAWGNSLSAPFEMDDFSSIHDNASIRHLWSFAWLHPPANAGQTVSGRPVLNFSFALNYALGGLDVRGYRAANILVHALAALTLFGIVRRTVEGSPRCRTGSSAGRPGAPLFALAVALIWLVHPLQTESVTYVVQRAESLMGLFCLLTLYCFIRGAESVSDPPPRQVEDLPCRQARRIWFSLSFVFCLLGMGTKEVTVTVPVLVLFYDRTFAAGGFAAAWRRRRGYYLALGSTWLVLAALVATTGGNRGGTSGFNVDAGWGAYWLTQFKAVGHYLALSLWPQSQVFEYGTFRMKDAGEVLPYALTVLALGIASVVALWRRPVLGFLGFWFFGILAPTSLVPGTIQMIVEHRMYLPLIAVVVLVCAAVQALGRRLAWPPWSGGLLAAAAVVTLGAATFVRNQVYRSELALWQDTVAKRPDNPRAHHNLGLALSKAGRVDEAMAEFGRAIALQPNHAFAHFQLGTIYLTRRQWTEAAGELQMALLADPHYVDARVNLGQALTELGRPGEAIAQYQAALTDQPDAQDARTDLGALLVAQGRTAEGEALLREAVEATPELAEAHYHLGLALEKNAGAAAAESELREAVRLKPEMAAAHLALGNVLAGRGRVSEAAVCYREAMKLDATLAEARYAWGNLLAKQQRLPEAMAAYQEALRLDPAHVPARNNLANCQLMTGRLDEAIANYEAVLRTQPDDAAVRRNLDLAREMKRTRTGEW